MEYLFYIGSYEAAVRLLKNTVLKGTFAWVGMEKRSRYSESLRAFFYICHFIRLKGKLHTSTQCVRFVW